MAITPFKGSGVHVRLTQSDREVLENRARRSGVALSVVIRKAIRLYLSTPDGVAPSQNGARERSRKFYTSSDGNGGA